MTPASVLSVVVTAQTAQAQAALAKLNTSLTATAARAKAASASTATSTAAAGASLTKNVTLPLVALGTAAVVMSMDYNKSMRLIQTQAGATATEMENMKKAVLDFAASGQTTKTPKELSEALYRVESAGYRGARAMDILKASTQLAEVGQSDLEDTTYAVVSAMQTGIKGTKNLKSTIGTLNAIVGQGNMRMEDLTQALSSGVLISARQVGLSLQDVGAALAMLTARGMPATTAATRLRMSFTLMAAPTDAAKEALASIGLEADALARVMQTKGLVPALTLLKTKLGDLDKVGQTQLLSEAFGGARSGTTIMAMIQNLDDVDRRLGNIGKTTDNFDESLKAVQSTAGYKLKASLAGLNAELIRLGDILVPIVVPAITDMLNVIGDLAQMFGGLPTPVQKVGVGLLIMAAAAGPILKLTATLLKLRAAMMAISLMAPLMGAGGLVGGLGAAGTAAGAGFAATFGLALLAGVGTAMLGKEIVDIIHGDMLEATKREDFSTILSDFGFDEKTFVGRNKVRVATAMGDLIFNAETGKVVRAKGKQLQDLIGMTARDAAKAIENLELFGGTGKGVKPIEAMVGTYDAAMAKMVESTSTKWGKIAGITSKRLSDIQSDIDTGTGKGRKAAAKNFDSMVSKIKRAMDAGKLSVGTGTDAINQILAAKMAALGLNSKDLGKIWMNTYHGKIPQLGPSVPGLGPKQQKGGAQLVKGAGIGDKVNVRARVEPGEALAVLNKKAAKEWMAWNAAFPRFAKGGYEFPEARGIGPGVIDDMAAQATNIFGMAANAVYQTLKQAGGPASWQAFDKLAASFGVSVGSQFRPGSITSSGNLSYHAQKLGGRSRATDYSDGAGAMLRFGLAMAQRYTPKLKELIHTPMGFAVKDGHKVAPYAEADHYDHVHVAMQKGGIVGDFATAVRRTGAPKIPTQALYMAGLAESGMRDLGYGDSTSEGVLQLLASTASSMGINPHNEIAVAEAFLKLGYWGKGGAIRLYRGGEHSPATIAHLVQGNATGTGVYSAQYDEARRLMRQAGLKFNKKGELTGATGGAAATVVSKKLKGKIAKLGLSPKVQAAINAVTLDADRFEELADRAAAMEEAVLGKDEIGWLEDALRVLFKLRNMLVRAHQAVATKIAKADEMLKKVKNPKARKMLKDERDALRTQDASIMDALSTVQGFGPVKVFDKTPPVGVLGGRIFDVQMRLREAGASTEATDATAKALTPADLKELHYLSTLGVKFNPSQFAGMFAKGGYLGAGKWGIAGERGPEPVFGPARIAPSGGSEIRVVLEDNRTAVYRDGTLEREVIHEEMTAANQTVARDYLNRRGRR